MAPIPVVLVHGYSASGESFSTWRDILTARFKAEGAVPPIHICNYVTLNNEVTIRDLAEGFERMLRHCEGLAKEEPFDAIVHSTGMLVVRCWLATYPERRKRLKHLIGLAPATFGSPIAHMGRSMLGAIFKGNKTIGPDFLNAGDMVLDGLELGSRFQWDLACKDLVGTEKVYGLGADTPYVFTFCGNQNWGVVASLLANALNEPGTDGTVRWSGVAMNSRKITIDLTRRPGKPATDRVSTGAWQELDIPLYPIDGKNHGTILSDPPDFLQDLVYAALQVKDEASFNGWTTNARARTKASAEVLAPYQQFIVRAIDDHGEPITDYNLEVMYKGKGMFNFTHPEVDLEVSVHTYRADASYRCFHMKLTDQIVAGKESDLGLKFRVMASTGSGLIAYSAFPVDDLEHLGQLGDAQAALDVTLDLAPLYANPDPKKRVNLFKPFTTTLIELKLTREPMPLDRQIQSKIFELMKKL